ncbi:hypothetical protein KKC60_00255 [Patescibacteria group bacterium]|nr:hypothetical protein [Patescibacteria group bacterium]
MSQEECCPKFDPAPWDKHVFEWDNKRFIKDKVMSVFNIPLNFGGVMKRLDQKLKEAGAATPEYMCLSDHTSTWNMNVYLAVNKEVPDAENVSMSGKFLSKVYEGDFKDTGKWMQDFNKYAQEKGMKIKKTFMWYTVCPKCAKKYGKNYVVAIGQVA